ncbi:MAG: hypothetical protein MJA82_13295 [Clostridia bacterium]|nr:hypothetical protein [Clostridia bacterium]
MWKRLEIDCFSNCYSVEEINCIDQPIAGAASYFNHENFYYYCFYYSLLSNWLIEFDFLTLRNLIFKKLGLELKVHQIEESSNFIPFVKSLLDKKKPVLMVPKRRTLVYDFLFGDQNIKSLHGFLVMEYNTKNPVLVIRDVAHVESSNAPYGGTGYGLFKLCLKEDLVLDIWNKSNEIYKNYKEKNNDFYKKIFSIEKTGKSHINNYIDLVEDFINNYDLSYSRLSHIISSSGTLNQKIKDTNYYQYIRRRFYKSLSVIFDIFIKYFNLLKLNNQKITKFIKFKEQYFKNRDLILSKLYVSALRGSVISRSDKTQMIQETQLMDQKLYSLINEIYKENHKQ